MQSTIQSIGASSAQSIDTLARIIASIRQPEAPEIDALLRSALEKLQACTCTLSVVGQVKAGKSSLINALTGIQDLLPTEVNPWTAVITNLHFGHKDKPESGGVFKLFSEAEWQRMIKGDAETRKLAEELLPGFDSKVLERQIHEMQETARKRLGDQYKHLLGKEHSFNAMTPEILERYVSAGNGEIEGGAGESTAGKFSGITESADVFLPAGPFLVPMTVSDTPGINDPFLVRDEITTNSFRFADIFIVAISAHQALNTADVALLKMLSHHSAKKTIIYVNRIDEVENPAETVPGILETLEARLAKEIANPNYTILSGSAFWGQVAATGSDADVAKATQSDAFKSMAASHVYGIEASQSDREQLYRASRLDVLAETVTKAVLDGPTGAALGEAITEVQAVINLMRANLRQSLAGEDVAHIVDAEPAAIVRAETARILARASKSGEIVRQLQEISNDGMRHVYDNTDLALSSAEEGVRSSVEAFVENQIHDLKQRAAGGKIEGEWTLDMARLGDTVVNKVHTNFVACRKELDKLLVGYAGRLNDVTAGTMADVRFHGLLENLPFDDILPAFKPKSSMVKVDLSASRGWQFWKSKSLSVDEAIDRIYRVLKAEMEPPLVKVIESLREAVESRSEAALGRLGNVLKAAIDLVQAEAQTLQKEAQMLTGASAQDRIPEIYEQRRVRARALEARISALDEAGREIASSFPALATASASVDDEPEAQVLAGANA